MKTILVLLGLAGCSPQYRQYDLTHRAFVQGCSMPSIASELNTEGDTLTMHATCTRDK